MKYCKGKPNIVNVDSKVVVVLTKEVHAIKGQCLWSKKFLVERQGLPCYAADDGW